MGYVFTVKASYWGNMGSVPKIGYYENDTSNSILIKSLTAPLGVGKAGVTFTYGNDVPGTGKPITYYVQCEGVNSNSITLTNQVGVLNAPQGTYPDRADCISYTVYFSSDIIVQPGGKVYFSLPFLKGNTANAFIIAYEQASVGTAIYNPITYYTVSYNANGGSNAPAPQTKASNAALTLTLDKPTGPYLTVTLDANGGSVFIDEIKYARAFMYWNTNSSGTGTSYSPGSAFTTNADTTLYAKWGPAIVGGLPTPSKPGNIFKGWFTSETGGTQISAGSPISSDVNLYAMWQSVYTISYDANGGSGAPSSQSKKEGETLKLTNDIPTTKKSVKITLDPNGGSVATTSVLKSCSFLRWNTSSNGSGKNYSPGDNYIADESATLYAIWSSASVGDLPVPSRSNCNFVGWYTAVNGGTKVTSVYTTNADITLYARWDYIITYNLNGGTVGEGETTIANSIKHHNVALTLTTLSPTKSGKSFLGWAERSTATSAKYAKGGTYTNDAPITLYAVYDIERFKVTFDLRGGTYTGGGALVQYVDYGDSATLPNNPTYIDKVFKGWVGNHTNITKDTIIYALWNGCPVWIKQSDGKWHSYID